MVEEIKNPVSSSYHNDLIFKLNCMIAMEKKQQTNIHDKGDNAKIKAELNEINLVPVDWKSVHATAIFKKRLRKKG